jgi:CelD/BcsL family acetyltransferase involved in cellulose biosynthesis
LCPFSFADAESSTGVRLRADSYAGFIDSVTRSDHGFVREIERRARRLASELGTIRFCWNVADPSAELERLIIAKRAQYSRTGVRDVLKGSSQRNLLHRLVRQPSSPECRPVVSALYAGDSWIASKLSLASPGSLHSWFSVFDPQYRRYGPGHLMNFSFIEAGIGEGFTCFDFGEGDAEYKFKYQGEPYLVWKGVIRRNSMGGMSERVMQSLEWRIDRAAIAARKIASSVRPAVEPGSAR